MWTNPLMFQLWGSISLSELIRFHFHVLRLENLDVTLNLERTSCQDDSLSRGKNLSSHWSVTLLNTGIISRFFWATEQQRAGGYWNRNIKKKRYESDWTVWCYWCFHRIKVIASYMFSSDLSPQCNRNIIVFVVFVCVSMLFWGLGNSGGVHEAADWYQIWLSVQNTQSDVTMLLFLEHCSVFSCRTVSVTERSRNRRPLNTRLTSWGRHSEEKLKRTKKQNVNLA